MESKITLDKIKVKFKYSLKKLYQLEISVKPNCHAFVTIKGELEETFDFCILNNLAFEKISIVEIEQEYPIFYGIVKDITLIEQNNNYIVQINAVSYTILLDRERKSKSYQNLNFTYNDIFMDILKEYDLFQVCFYVNNKKINAPIIQYNETDWEFMLRLSSHLNTSIIPDIRIDNINILLGLRNGNEIFIPLQEHLQKICFDKKYYDIDNILNNKSKIKYIYYEVQSEYYYNIGDFVIHKSEKMFVCSKHIILKNGILLYMYILACSTYFKIPLKYNSQFKGLSLKGEVLDRKEEYLKLHLDIDNKRDVNNMYWFPWKPETGNGIYCMPEIGTKVSLYFESNDEKNAYCINCFRNSNIKGKFFEPDKRYLITNQGKELNITNTELTIKTKNILGSISIDDLLGIVLQCDKKLTIQAKQNINLYGRKVIINAKKELSLIKKDIVSPTVINLCNAFNSIGKGSSYKSTKCQSKITFFQEKDMVQEYDLTDVTENIISSVPIVNNNKLTSYIAGTNCLIGIIRK